MKTGHSLKERNQAVWALGQLGNRDALPILKSTTPDRNANTTNSSASTNWKRLSKRLKAALMQQPGCGEKTAAEKPP